MMKRLCVVCKHVFMAESNEKDQKILTAYLREDEREKSENKTIGSSSHVILLGIANGCDGRQWKQFYVYDYYDDDISEYKNM